MAEIASFPTFALVFVIPRTAILPRSAYDKLGADLLGRHRCDRRLITLAAKRNRSGQQRRRKFVAITPRLKKVGCE